MPYLPRLLHLCPLSEAGNAELLVCEISSAHFVLSRRAPQNGPRPRQDVTQVALQATGKEKGIARASYSSAAGDKRAHRDKRRGGKAVMFENSWRVKRGRRA